MAGVLLRLSIAAVLILLVTRERKIPARAFRSGFLQQPVGHEPVPKEELK